MIQKPSECEGCPWYGDGKGFVPDEVREDSRVVVIAQNPGENEEAEGRPLIGRSGKIVENELQRYGISREKCSFCNIMHCRLNHTNFLPPTKETSKAAEFCFKTFTLPGLRKLKANVYVPLGDLALNYTTGFDDIKKWRGSLMVPDAGPLAGKKVLPTIHPAFLFTDMTLRAAVKHDFARVARESKSSEPTVKYTDNFRINVTAGEFIDTLKSLGTSRVALDIETSYNKPIDAKLKVIGIAWSKEDAMNWFVGEEWPVVIDALSEFQGEFVTATPFDYAVLTRLGVKFAWERCHDLTLLHSRFDIETSHKVDYICSVWSERPYWKYLASLEHGKYNCLDCVAEFEAFEKLYQYCRLHEPGIWKCYDADRRMLPIAVDLHLNGLPLDQEMFEEEKAYYEERRGKLQAEVSAGFEEPDKPGTQPPPQCDSHKRYTGRTEVRLRSGEQEECPACRAIRAYHLQSLPLNLRSGKQLIQKLEESGMVVPKVMDKKSKKTKKSIAKGKLADMLKKYGDPRLAKLLEFKRMDTMVTRYFNEAKVSQDGRIHSTFNMHAAMHRWSSDEPNVQQMARPEEVK